MKSLWIAAAMGLAVSSGHPAGLAVAVWMPAASLSASTRTAKLKIAAAYFVAALWPMVPGLVRYLGMSYLSASCLWFLTALLLSAPWTLGRWALVLSTIPPLGLIGLASPLAGVGYWLPGTSWFGLIAVVSAQTALISYPHRRRAVVIAFCTLSAGAHLAWHEPVKPVGWKAVNTHFGDLSSPVNRILAVRSIQHQITLSNDRVLIFPESVAANWSEAEWSSVTKPRQVIVIGATMSHDAGPLPRDFEAALAVLRGTAPPIEGRAAVAYYNVVQIRGAETATFVQSIPVPIGMWRPFTHSGVSIHPFAPGVIIIDHQRAAILICYEQMLAWPVLTSMLSRPTVIIAVSNTFWFHGTPIPRYQASAVRSWAKLFGLPYLLAVNSESHEVETTNPSQSRSVKPVRNVR